MTVGLPGAGIGGLFYLMAALLMPVRELGRTLRGRSSLARWGLVGRQFANAAGIAAGTWATGWLIVIGARHLVATTTTTAGAGGAGGAPTHVLQLLRPAQGIATLLLLGAILIAMALLAAVLGTPAPAVVHRPHGAAPKLAAPRGDLRIPTPTAAHPPRSLTPSAARPAWVRRERRHRERE